MYVHACSSRLHTECMYIQYSSVFNGVLGLATTFSSCYGSLCVSQKPHTHIHTHGANDTQPKTQTHLSSKNPRWLKTQISPSFFPFLSPLPSSCLLRSSLAPLPSLWLHAFEGCLKEIIYPASPMFLTLKSLLLPVSVRC